MKLPKDNDECNRVDLIEELVEETTLQSGQPTHNDLSDSDDESMMDDGPHKQIAQFEKIEYEYANFKNESSKLADAENPKISKPAFEGLEAEVTTNKHKSGASGMKVGSSLASDTSMEEREMAKERSNWKDYCLCEGIIVEVMSKGLADQEYYRQKGVIIKVIDWYVGEIDVLDSKHVLKVDQEELETVIPQIGGLVRIVNGAYRDQMQGYCQLTQIITVIYDGQALQAVDYEDICKITQ